MTIASLKDLGYAVNLSARDTYRLPSGLSATLLRLREAQGIGGDALTETLAPPRFEIAPNGTARPVTRISAPLN